MFDEHRYRWEAVNRDVVEANRGESISTDHTSISGFLNRLIQFQDKNI